MVDKLLEALSKVGLWLGSKANRLRLRGARIEVIVIVLSRVPSPTILLGQSPFHGTWMPPQEGVLLNEAFPDALHRCLRDECGIEVPADDAQRRRMFYVRSIRYVGMLDLPPERIGDREVADDAHGTPLESVVLRKKAYWLATVLVRDAAQFNAKADGIELTKVEWFPIDEARRLILRTNTAPKGALLALCVDRAGRAMQGSTP